MKRILALILPVALLGCVPAKSPQEPNRDVADMIAQWNGLNSLCRGGYPSDPKTLPACDAREALTGEIAARGFCYGENAEYGYQQRWDICNDRR